MKPEKFSARRRQIIAMGAISTMGVGAMAVPAAALAAGEPLLQFSGGKIVVSGRVVGAADGRALAGAQIEIWQADARGVRVEGTHEVMTADGDGRYFAALTVNAPRLLYRVSHKGYTTRLAQLNGAPQQRTVSLTRDDAGVTRAAFEMKLVPRNATAAGAPDVVAL
jgi:hypothetical protein